MSEGGGSGCRVVAASDISLGYLLDAAQSCSKHTYEGVAECMLGRVGWRIVYACVVVLQVLHPQVMHTC